MPHRSGENSAYTITFPLPCAAAAVSVPPVYPAGYGQPAAVNCPVRFSALPRSIVSFILPFSLAFALASNFSFSANRSLIVTLYFFNCPEKFSICGKPLFQHGEGFLFLSGVQWVNAVKGGFMALACLERETACLKIRVGICFRPVLLALPHAPSQDISPPYRRENRPATSSGCPVADNLLCAQAVVLCQRNKGQMQVGRFLIHVYHRRHDISRPTRPMRNLPPFGRTPVSPWGFPLEKLRAGGYQRIDNRVLSSLSGIRPARYGSDEVVMRPSGLTIWKLYLLRLVLMSGLLVYCSFCLRDGLPAALPGCPCASQTANCVLCHSAPFPIPFLSGVFYRENPAGIISDTIRMEWI